MKGSRCLSFTSTLPGHLYYDAKVFRGEMENIFKKNWLFLACSSLLPPGYALADEVVPSMSLVATKSKTNNELNVFHNVCRHRAGPLVYNGDENKSGDFLTCKYHKWCYSGTSGKLVSTPGFGDPNLEKEQFSLHRCEFEEVNGLLFVRLDTENNNKKTASSSFGNLFSEKVKLQFLQ